jgi:hypothetical protein
MSDVIALTELELDITTCSARFFTMLREETRSTSGAHVGLLLDPPYQRASVWTVAQQRLLMRSFLTRLPVPAVVINDRFQSKAFIDAGREDWRTALVDGRQRVEAILAWVDGELTLPADWFGPEYVDETTTDVDGTRMVSSRGLTVPGARLVGSRIMLPVAQAAVATVEEEAAIYLMLNTGGTAHSEEDLSVARKMAQLTV